MNRSTLVLVVLVSLLIVPATVTADAVSGTVVVDDGTADGDTVTVAPLDARGELVGDPIETTVDGGSFEYDSVDGATTYFVELEHDGATHYALVDDGEAPELSLTETLTVDLVDEDGASVSNASVTVVSQDGPPVTEVNATDGTVTLDPVQPNRTYTLEIRANGADYERTVTTGDDRATVELPTPTTDREAVALGGGDPVNHLLRVGPPENGSGLFVAETVSLETDGDRPYAGDIPFALPPDATAVAGAVDGDSATVSQDGETATVEATVAPGETTTVDVYYQLSDRTFEKAVGYDVEEFAVGFVGYDQSQVEVSDNLVEADAPTAMVTNAGPLSADERISVSVADDTQSTDDENGPATGGFPLAAVGGAFLLVVVGGLAAYRLF